MSPYRKYKNSGNYIVGDIPEHWDVSRLKYFCSGFSNGTTATQVEHGENTVKVTRIESISSGAINYNKTGFIEYSPSIESYRLNDGDILLSHINSYEKVGNSAIYHSEEPLFHGMNLLRLIPRENINRDYLYYYIKSLPFILQIQRNCKPAINQVSIPSVKIRNIVIPIPPIEEQAHIVDFLKTHVSAIDCTINDKVGQIEQFELAKRMMISKVVMQGLDHSVELVETHIPWIGSIPSSWDLCRVKDAFIISKAKAKIDNPVVLSLARSGVRVRDISTGEGQLAESYFDYNPIVPGDLLLNPMDLYSGANCNVSEISGVISPAYINLRAKDGFIPKYYDYYFKSQYWSMALFAHGKGVSFDNRWTLNNRTLLAYRIPVPSLQEQNEIVSYLNKETAQYETAIKHSKDSISLLQEYKQRLISDVVTGQLNVQDETA